jgi:D-xylose transport system substrate-binding protein
MGKTAGDAAVQLCKDKDVTKVSGTAPFDSPEGNKLTSILLTPQPITKDNLNVVIDAGWTTKENVCKGVTAGSVDPC